MAEKKSSMVRPCRRDTARKKGIGEDVRTAAWCVPAGQNRTFVLFGKLGARMGEDKNLSRELVVNTIVRKYTHRLPAR